MFRNYFKTAIRNLLRNKSYAIINVVGLAVGIAACLLIFLVVQFQLSFDKFHSNKDKIYRVVSEFHNAEGVFHSSGVPFPVGSALRLDYPQVKVASIFNNNNEQITVKEDGKAVKKFIEPGIYYAEPEFFQMFDFELLAGDFKTALTAPFTALLTQEVAERYFGDWKSAIGKTITHRNRHDIRVTGILKNVPANSDFPFGVVASYATLEKMSVANNMTDWVSTFSQAYCFVILPPELPAANFNKSLKTFVKKHKPAEYAKDELIIQALSEMHFDDRFGNYSGRTFSHDLITALTLIGLFLLVIACVNFINLATAQAVNRSKEVGVRKVLGSNRLQLAAQFMSETALITLVAVGIAVAIAAAILPLLNQLLQLKLTLSFTGNPSIILFLLATTLAVILLSGFYPALILSGFNPITALKSRITPRMAGGISLRRALVVLQFAIAQVLIIGMIVVVSQMDYFRNKDLGFDKEALVTVSIPSDSLSQLKMETLRNKLTQHPGIKKLTFSYANPADDGNWSSDFKFDHSEKSTEFSANLKWADVNYFETYNLQFVAGEPYRVADTPRGFVVNETLVKKLGIKDAKDALGKEMNFWDGGAVGPIVGVVKDFHVNSLRDPLSAVAMATWKRMYQQIGIKIQGGNIKETTGHIERLWNETYPDYVYRQQFLDERIDNFYRQENQLSQLYKIFAAIAILISCLGLYGLVSFMAAQRTKEVGIRKVLGATVGKIVYLFSKEFTVLIGLAFVIAGPVAYYIVNNWLENFTFRIKPGAGIFITAIVMSIIIAWLTVGYRAVKAALANPVKSLRTE
jgi:putative ABC transport system permease protein